MSNTKPDLKTLLDGYAFGYFRVSEEDIARDFVYDIIVAKMKFFESLENRTSMGRQTLRKELANMLIEAANEIISEHKLERTSKDVMEEIIALRKWQNEKTHA